nr:MAG TPA: hypothetical protein [Caudoviricetes sp.]
MKKNTDLYDLLKELDNLLSIPNKDHEEQVTLSKKTNEIRMYIENKYRTELNKIERLTSLLNRYVDLNKDRFTRDENINEIYEIWKELISGEKNYCFNPLFLTDVKGYSASGYRDVDEIANVGYSVARMNRNICTLIQQMNYIINKLEEKGIL